MGTVEKEQDVIKIFLVDGTCKGFLVTSTMTVNALKYLVAQKTNVDKSDWNNFGVYMATREKIVGPLVDKPYDVHKKWGRHSGFDLRFVFKRVDEPYPAEPEDPVEETPEISTPAAGVEPPTSAGPVISTRITTHSPQNSKTKFGDPGSPSIFRRKITNTPTLNTTPDPTISYNTAKDASVVQSDPNQSDLGYDYNLEMSTPAYDLTYMKVNGSNEDMYAHIDANQEPGLSDSNDQFYSNLEQQSEDFTPDLDPTDLAQFPHVGLSQQEDVPQTSVDKPQQEDVPKQVISPGISRTTSAQVSMRVPTMAAPKPPTRAQSTQVAINGPTPPRIGNTVPKRPPPPSSLRKSAKSGVKIITSPGATASPTNNTSAEPSRAPSSPKTAPKMSPKSNPKTSGGPKSGHFKMPPPASQRPVSAQFAVPPKAVPKSVATSNSPSGSPPPQRKLLYKTEDATKSRHEQHKQIVISWINSQLACRGISIRNLTGDIQDGVALIKLLEVLSEKKLEKYYGVPKMMMQKLDNLGHFLSFLRVLGIRIDGVSAEDLYVGNENLTLAILLVVLRKYGAAVPKPARRPSRSSVSSTTPRKSSTSQTNNSSPVRKASSGSNTTPTGATPKRKTSGATSSPNLSSPTRKTSNAGTSANTSTTPVRKTSRTNGTAPAFTMPPPARVKSGMPKTAPKRPGTPQLPRKTSDKVMPKKPVPVPDANKQQVKRDEKPVVEQKSVVDAVEQPVVEQVGQPENIDQAPTDLTGTMTNTASSDVVAKLGNAVSEVDKILEDFANGGSQADVLDQLESPKAPEELQVDYNNAEYYDQYMDTFNTKFGETLMIGGNNNTVNDDMYNLSLKNSTDDSTPPSLEQIAETKFQTGSFIRSQPQGIKSPEHSGSIIDSPKISPRGSPRTFIGQRGSPNEPSGAIAIPSKPKVVADPVGSPRFRNSPKPGNTKLPPHKMLMMHSQTSKYMSGSRGSGNLDSLKATSAPSLGSNSNTSSPVTSPTSHRKSSIVDESGNVYTEVIKLDDLSADLKDEVDPRFELDLTVNAGSKQKNSAFRDPNKTTFDLTNEIEDIDSLMENVMMTLGPSNNNVEINWD